LPNNTGKIDDDLTVHDASSKRLAEGRRSLGSNLKVVLLVPVFPRPKTDWRIYTHALDRDSLLTEKKELRRFDLQLISMIDNARERLRVDGLRVDERVMMYGFSASGMFTNRFAMLHPDRVKAAAFGSPGGWALAPIASWKGKALRYPIGTTDFETITGKELDLERLRKVPLFCSWEPMTLTIRSSSEIHMSRKIRDLIFRFVRQDTYRTLASDGSNLQRNFARASLKLYPNIGHSVTKRDVE
jgi:pimeloyl-ACP methyl ester carboxylesterase